MVRIQCSTSVQSSTLLAGICLQENATEAIVHRWPDCQRSSLSCNFSCLLEVGVGP